MGRLVTIGADPEFFILNRDGSPQPICGLLGGTKTRPIRMSPNLPSTYTMQEDNVMVEFNVPPASNANTFITSIQSALSALNTHLTGMGYLISQASELQFANRLLTGQAQQFGCSPDFNAHADGQESPRIDPNVLNTGQTSWRFAGGHVHIGYSSRVPAFVAASFADVFIGLKCVPYDGQSERRKYYGQPGRFRPTPYGIEYRTLSNFWIWDYSMLHEVAYGALALGQYLQTTPPTKIQKDYASIPWESVKDAVATSDSRMATQVRNFCNAELGWQEE